MSYLTIVIIGPEDSVSLPEDSASCMDAAFDSFACAIALWKSSQRCRADSFLNVSEGKSVCFSLFDILQLAFVLLLGATIGPRLDPSCEAVHSLPHKFVKQPCNAWKPDAVPAFM